MNNLVSGMILIEKTYGDAHMLVTTPYGWKIIDANGSCIDFEKENYEKAYIPKDYENPWEPIECTVIEFEEQLI